MSMTQEFRTEKVAPEGRWGYIMGIGMSITFGCGLGMLTSFGLMFNEFLTSLGAGTSAVTTITGIFFGAMSITSLLASVLFKKFSMRSIGVAGALIYSLGNFLTIFVTSAGQLSFTFGVLQGGGMGFMVSVGYTTFNHYFVKKRIFMMGLAQAVKGVIIMSYPLVVQFLMDEYGFRGAMAIVAAINSNAIFGMIVMHPVSMHYKTIKVPINETKKLIETNQDKNLAKIDVILDDECKEKPVHVQKKSLPNEYSQNDIEIGREAIILKLERSKSLDATQSFEEFDSLRERIKSTMSICETGVNIITCKSYLSIKSEGKWQRVAEFLDLALLKDFVYVNICVGLAFLTVSDNSLFTLLPLYLYKIKDEIGCSNEDVAYFTSLAAGADMCSRICLAVLSLLFQYKSRNAVFAAAIAALIFRIAFLFVHNSKGIMALIMILGFIRSWIHVPTVLAIAEYLPQERFATGLSLFLLIQGFFALSIAPLAGWIRDFAQSYAACFCSLIFITSLCPISWLIEMVWLRFYPKNASAANSK